MPLIPELHQGVTLKQMVVGEGGGSGGGEVLSCMNNQSVNQAANTLVMLAAAAALPQWRHVLKRITYFG